jgi:4-azaleucine resistance transporter AzlC
MRFRQQAWFRGVTQALPIVMGYVPIGFAFGVLAQQAGLSTLNTLLMSLLVYAGSAQLIAVGLYATGALPLSMISTTFIVNLRHLLMSAALSPFLKHWPSWSLAGFAYELTDETFAVHTTQFVAGNVDRAPAFARNITAHIAWIGGTGLGIVAGQRITDVELLALDYVLPAMFIALLVIQIQDRLQVGVALSAGVLAVGLQALGLHRWHVMVATLIAATLGAMCEIWGARFGLGKSEQSRLRSSNLSER